MPFGLKNAAQTFQRFMVRGVPSAYTYTYIDDVLIASATPEQHLQDLHSVFERLSSHGIVINPNKCLFGVHELDFLGHHIDQHGITPLPEKVQAVRDFPQPQTQRQLRQFIELLSPISPSLCQADATPPCSSHCLQAKVSAHQLER